MLGWEPGLQSPESIRSNGNIMKLDILSRIENSMTEIQFVNKTHLRTVESLESVYADISIIWNLILLSFKSTLDRVDISSFKVN